MMLRLDIIPGLRPEDQDYDWHYKMRDKDQDMPRTKEYYEAHPPAAGDTVVVLHTWGGKMCKPHVTSIEAITSRKRLVVDHYHQGWAGKSFWRTGQNCYAPKGQCWLVPGELYADIPVSPDLEWDRGLQRVREKARHERLGLIELANFFGGSKRLAEELRLLAEETGLTGEEAIKILGEEVKAEKQFNWMRKKVSRETIRNHHRISNRKLGGGNGPQSRDPA